MVLVMMMMMLYTEFFSICSVGFHSVTQTRFMHFKEVDEKRRTDSFDVLGVPLLLLIILFCRAAEVYGSHHLIYCKYLTALPVIIKEIWGLLFVWLVHKTDADLFAFGLQKTTDQTQPRGLSS